MLTEERTPFHETMELTSKSPEIAEDRLSELPDAVMQQILSLCPVKEAVRICTLARQWQSLWTSMPELLFHYKSGEDADKFASFIDKVLTLYSAPKVKTFVLQFPYEDRFKDRVDSWLLFAATHGVEELCLYKQFNVHDALISNDVLGGCCWISLKVLDLYELALRMEMITSIFRGSSLLESLTLDLCQLIGSSHMFDATNTKLKELILEICEFSSHFDAFHAAAASSCVAIKAPNLRSLTVEGYMHTTKLILVDVSSLVEANIGLAMKWPSASKKKIIKDILDKLFHVNRLTLGVWVLQVLSLMTLDGEIIPALRCRTLRVEMNLHQRYLTGIRALVDNSPHMEHLIMNLSPYANNRNRIDGENYRSSDARILSCLNNNLRRVEVAGFVPREPRWRTRNRMLIEMMRSVLDNAKMLQKLIVHAGLDSKDELLDIQENILSHPRASPNAQVEFLIPSFIIPSFMLS